jgi:hypothetical protein
MQPLLEVHTPALADTITSDHERIDGQIAALEVLAERSIDAARSARRDLAHRLYLAIASFTSAYLAHQDFEELEVMPALSLAVGADELAAVHHELIASISPDEMASSLAVMLPAMDIDGRAELLGGLQAGAPPEVFAGVWGLTESVLTDEDARALAARLGVS